MTFKAHCLKTHLEISFILSPRCRGLKRCDAIEIMFQFFKSAFHFNCAYEITRTETRKISVKHKKLHKSYSNFYIHDNGHFLKIGVITRKVFFLMFT